MSQEPTTANVLETAVDILETGGWTRGAYYQDGAHCAVGAITSATKVVAQGWETDIYQPDVVLRQRAVDVLCKVLKQRFSAGNSMLSEDVVVGWNDKLAEDQYQVIDAMKLAAKEPAAQRGLSEEG